MEQKGLIGALFDFSFDEFVTTKIIRVFYGLLLLLIGLATFMGVVAALGMMFSRSFTMGLGMLILVPIAGLVYLILARASTELIIVIFRIAENTRTLVQLRQAEGRGAAPPEV